MVFLIFCFLLMHFAVWCLMRHSCSLKTLRWHMQVTSGGGGAGGVGGGGGGSGGGGGGGGGSGNIIALFSLCVSFPFQKIFSSVFPKTDALKHSPVYSTIDIASLKVSAFSFPLLEVSRPIFALASPDGKCSAVHFLLFCTPPQHK